MLPAEIIRKIRRIDIKTRLLVDEMFSGEYHSIFKGRGLEFSEVREYIYGDDVRTIDWNVTARLGKPFVKVYEEERELNVLILFDMSASTLFGSREATQREMMVELSALFAFSAIENNDLVGAVLFSQEIEEFIPPRKEKIHALRILRELLYRKAEHAGTSLKRAVDFVNNTQTRRSIVFILSDFFDGGYEKPFTLMTKRHDVIPIIFRDPFEEAIRSHRGILMMRDIETGKRAAVDLADRRVLQEFTRNLNATRIGAKKLFTSCGIDYIELTAGEPYIKALIGFFNRRAHRL
jgi:uncharacterized protein (DUF58 family)